MINMVTTFLSAKSSSIWEGGGLVGTRNIVVHVNEEIELVKSLHVNYLLVPTEAIAFVVSARIRAS